MMNDGDGDGKLSREALETRLENYRKSLEACHASVRILFEHLIEELERQLQESDSTHSTPKDHSTSKESPPLRAAKKLPPPRA